MATEHVFPSERSDMGLSVLPKGNRARSGNGGKRSWNCQNAQIAESRILAKKL